MTGSRRIIIDANILIRAVLGVRVAELVEHYSDRVSFFAPQVAFTEAGEHLPSIAETRGLDSSVLLDSLDRLRLVVETVPPDTTDPLKTAALNRIEARERLARRELSPKMDGDA